MGSVVLKFTILIWFVIAVTGKIMVLPDDKIEPYVKPEDAAGVFDISKLEIVIESDTDIFLNGTWKFLKEVKKWKGQNIAEQFDRGAWSKRGIDRKWDDFCPQIHNPTELWYNMFKKVKECPFPAGVNLTIYQFYRLSDIESCSFFRLSGNSIWFP